jgi:cytochrome c
MLASLLLIFEPGVCSHAQAQSLSAGEIVFVRECSSCHQIGMGAQHRIGPQLNHLFGRKAGGLSDYTKYSDALLKADFIWTPEKFRSFIKDPKKIIAGSMQIYDGLSNDRDIDYLIDFLQSKNDDK